MLVTGEVAALRTRGEVTQIKLGGRWFSLGDASLGLADWFVGARVQLTLSAGLVTAAEVTTTRGAWELRREAWTTQREQQRAKTLAKVKATKKPQNNALDRLKAELGARSHKRALKRLDQEGARRGP